MITCSDCGERKPEAGAEVNIYNASHPGTIYECEADADGETTEWVYVCADCVKKCSQTKRGRGGK